MHDLMTSDFSQMWQHNLIADEDVEILDLVKCNSLTQSWMYRFEGYNNSSAV